MSFEVLDNGLYYLPVYNTCWPQHSMTVIGVDALLTTLHPETESDLQEAGLDSLCKLATEPDNRQHLIDKVVPATPCNSCRPETGRAKKLT